MIKISILYPNNKGSRFDISYYIETHMPMSIKLLSAHPGFKGVSVERGLDGATPGSEPTYIAMCHLLFTSVEDFLAAFMPNASVLQGDMPNYTDIEPIIQFNEVLISRQLSIFVQSTAAYGSTIFWKNGTDYLKTTGAKKYK